MRSASYILLTLIALPAFAFDLAPIPTAATKLEPSAIAKAIDADIAAHLTESNIPASAPCTDAEFLRRVTLDLTGTIPTTERVKSFLADTRSNKRSLVIDELLASNAYGAYLGSIWFDLLVTPNDDNKLLVNKAFEPWLAEQFNHNRGWDKIVTDILTAKGKRDENAATIFWLAHSDMNAKPAHVKTADAIGSITQRFLGMQLQCAECHDHPFTPLRQTDFWGAAAFFGSMDLKNAQKKMLKEDGVPTVLEKSATKGSIEIPDSNGDSAKTQFPDGTPYDATKAGSTSLRKIFADWCTSPSNKQFSRAMSNRMWAHFFARGIVNPIDDFRKNNPPSHPETLDLLTNEFTASGYDLKFLARCICLSQTYQRSSDTLPKNADDESNFSHAPLKMLNATVLANSLSASLGEDIGNEKGGKRRNKPKVNNKKKGTETAFETAFATSEEPDDPEYSHGVPQVLHLMNGSHLDGAPLLESVERMGTDTRGAIEHLYLATLSRLPTSQERTRMQSFIDGSHDKNAGFAGVLWALLNSSEYVLNH